MPLLLRLGQHTLKGSLGSLGRYVETTGLWSLLEESTGVVWNKIPIQLVPAILMEGRAYRIDAASGTESIDLGDLEGLIGLVGPIGTVESNGVSTGLYYSNTTGLRGESMLLWAPNSNTLGGLWILDSQRLDCRPWRSDPILYRIELLQTRCPLK